MNKFLGIFILSIIALSCSSNLDFNQVNDLKLEPVVVANLATFDVPANQFVSGGVEIPVSREVSTFDVFRNSFFNDNLKRTDFYFDIDNTINRDYLIDMIMFDSKNVPIYTIHFIVPANSKITKTEIFENSQLDLLKKTRKIGFVITMPPSVPVLTENSLGSLKFLSSATVYLVVQ